MRKIDHQKMSLICNELSVEKSASFILKEGLSFKILNEPKGVDTMFKAKIIHPKHGEIGTVGIQHVPSLDIAYPVQAKIEPQFQRMGLGTSLYQFAHKESLNRGWGPLHSDIARDTSIPAKRMWMKMQESGLAKKVPAPVRRGPSRYDIYQMTSPELP